MAGDWVVQDTYRWKMTVQCQLTGGMLTGQVLKCGESCFDTCRCYGGDMAQWAATWHPSIGWLWENFMDSTGVEPVTSGPGSDLAGPGYQPAHIGSC
jgi:hypothetical protein